MDWQYVVLLGAVIVVGSFIMPKRNGEPDSSASARSVQNMETALENFMENMERDNENLVELVKQAQEAARQESERKDKRIASLERRCEQLEERLQAALKRIEAPAAERGAATTVPPAAASDADAQSERRERIASDSIQARYAELFQLYNDGKSIEAIAKKLGMNKGEVGLIIGLAKQEGAEHV